MLAPGAGYVGVTGTRLDREGVGPSLERGKRYVGVHDRNRGGEIGAIGGVDRDLERGERATNAEL